MQDLLDLHLEGMGEGGMHWKGHLRRFLILPGIPEENYIFHMKRCNGEILCIGTEQGGAYIGYF